MATKTPTAKSENPATPTAESVVLPTTDQMPGVTLETLREQKKQLEAQIKALRTAAPKRDGLQAEIKKQAEHPTLALVHSLGAYARQRVKLGQAPDAAKVDLLQICGVLIDTGLARAAEPKATATDSNPHEPTA